MEIPSLFRITVWPASLPEVTRIEDVGPFRLDGDLLKVDLAAAHLSIRELPDELYLRELRDLDLDDANEIVEFVNRYGRLGHRSNPVRRSDGDDLALDRQLIRLLGVDLSPSLDDDLPSQAWWDEIDRALRSRKRPRPSVAQLGASERLLIETDGLQHIDSFRAWATAFRRMTDLLRQYQDDEIAQDDLVTLTIVLTELLAPFSPALGVADKSDENHRYDIFRDLYPRLENVLALQMYRHIQAEDVYAVCKNEPCGRLFVRQRGRAKHGQYRRTGVVYCSAACARAQAQRELRRKQAKDKQNESERGE